MKKISTALAICLATQSMAEDADRGQTLFVTHCATCHGARATGDGPMVAVLSVKPADLTRLNATNDGVFPIGSVIRRIDGTNEVMAHGGPMPLFGLLLDGPSDVVLAPDGSEVIAPEAIVDIVAWLQTIQVDG